MRCWGLNDDGQLGDGSTTTNQTPTQVVGITDAIGVACGESHACVERADASVSCWGANDSGQLGIGVADTGPHPVPTDVIGF